MLTWRSCLPFMVEVEVKVENPGALSDRAVELKNFWRMFGDQEKWDRLSPERKHYLNAVLDDGLWRPRQ